MKRLTTMLAAGSVAALLLAGCSTSGATDEAAPAGTNRPAETAVEEPAAEEVATEEPAAPTNPKFGETYTWEDGLSVTVSAPAPYAPSDTSFVSGTFPAFISLTVTIVNGTTANFDPVMFSTSLQSGNAEAEQVFDTAQGLNGTPTTAILPGRETQFVIGFGVNDPADLVLEVTPSFDYDSAFFTS